MDGPPGVRSREHGVTIFRLLEIMLVWLCAHLVSLPLWEGLVDVVQLDLDLGEGKRYSERLPRTATARRIKELA